MVVNAVCMGHDVLVSHTVNKVVGGFVQDQESTVNGIENLQQLYLIFEGMGNGGERVYHCRFKLIK